MDKQKLVDNLFACAQDDWLALWMIAADVEAELELDDPDQTREVTVEFVRELLKRGLIAGDSPATGDWCTLTPGPIRTRKPLQPWCAVNGWREVGHRDGATLRGLPGVALFCAAATD